MIKIGEWRDKSDYTYYVLNIAIGFCGHGHVLGTPTATGVSPVVVVGVGIWFGRARVAMNI